MSLRNQPTNWEQLQIQIFCNKNRAQYPETKQALRQNLIWDCDVYSSTNVNVALICTGLHGLSSCLVEILFWTSLSTGILFGDTIPKLNKALSKLRTQQLEYIFLCNKQISRNLREIHFQILKTPLKNSKNGRSFLKIFQNVKFPTQISRLNSLTVLGDHVPEAVGKLASQKGKDHLLLQGRAVKHPESRV